MTPPPPGSRAVLVYPRTGQDVYGINVGLPLGVLSVASSLMAGGHPCAVVDERVAPDFPAALRRAVTPETLFVGISSMTGHQIRGGIAAARLVREVSPLVPIVWGGVHPSLVPDSTIAHPLVDVVVLGEGEVTARELADAMVGGRDLSEVPGLVLKAGGRVVRTPDRPPVEDLDGLPPPAYDLVDLDDYRTIGHIIREPQAQLVTSRGCTHRCGFCYNLLFNGGRYRAASAGRVYADLVRLHEKTGLRCFFLYDDYFFADRGRVSRLMDLLEGAGARFQFEVSCRVDFLDRADEEFLRRLRRNGFQELLVGVESGNDETLRKIGKGFTVEQVLRVNRKIAAVGFNAKYSFMAGFPEEGEGQLFDTVDVMRRILRENPNISVTPLAIYTPYPGTPLFQTCVDRGMSNFPASLEEWADYNWVEARHSFLDRRRVRFLNRLNMMSRFFDRRAFERFGSRLMRPLVMGLYGVYHAVIEFRLRRRWLGFMPEAALINRLQEKYVDKVNRGSLSDAHRRRPPR